MISAVDCAGPGGIDIIHDDLVGADLSLVKMCKGVTEQAKYCLRRFLQGFGK